MPAEAGHPRHLDETTCPVGYTCCEARPIEDVHLFLSDKSHLSTENCLSGSFCIERGKEWMLLLYVTGILYMFVALAVVCEEFFVPSLEHFVDEFDISLDVAGATFMAAGGSMPELFTSFIGTFKDSDVGMAAIVGSAVFNVLFVIATCAVASREVLELTWWPLARDCSYYLLTLVTLAVFFKGSSAGLIHFWEALILLLEYVGYCTLMKNNERVHTWVLKKTTRRKVQDVAAGLTPAFPQDAPDRVANEQTRTVDGSGTPGHDKAIQQASFSKPSSFRQSLVRLMVGSDTIADTAGMVAVARLAGNLKATFDRFDADQSGHIDTAEFRSLLQELGLKADGEGLDSYIRALTRLSGDGKITFEVFKKWYLASEVRIDIRIGTLFNSLDRNRSGTIEREEVAALLSRLGHQPSDEEVAGALAEMASLGSEPVARSDSEPCNAEDKYTVPVKDGSAVTFKQFCAWYKKSLFWVEKQKQIQPEDLEENGFTLERPDSESLSAWLWYVLTYPICAAMYVTMPDVRRPGEGKLRTACLEFLLSLVWIGFFSLSLVEWTEITSNTIGIPVPVAGLTVLAAGTSIPDLLSSYIVAKQGQGDMAVSSSIGSNIFDVTVGLPLPWLVYSLAKGKPVVVRTESLGVSIIVLTLMIAAVVITMKIMKWRMTKCLGYVMFLLYLVFLLQALVMQMPEGDPLVVPPF